MNPINEEITLTQEIESYHSINMQIIESSSVHTQHQEFMMDLKEYTMSAMYQSLIKDNGCSHTSPIVVLNRLSSPTLKQKEQIVPRN
jgi:hypothetical protein